MISQMQMKMIKAFVHGDTYDALETLKNDIIAKTKEQSSVGESEFITLKLTIEKESKVRALEEFFEELLKI